MLSGPGFISLALLDCQIDFHSTRPSDETFKETDAGLPPKPSNLKRRGRYNRFQLPNQLAAFGGIDRIAQTLTHSVPRRVKPERVKAFLETA